MPPTPHVTTFSLTYDEERLAETVEASLSREVGEIDNARSATTIAREGRTVRLEVKAADLVALRAASNTWLSLASVAERAADAAG